MPELRVLAREHDIAMTDQLGAAGEAKSMHLRDGGLVDVPQPLPSLDGLVQAEAIAGDGELRARMLRALQVVAGGKRAPGAANDQHTGALVALELAHHAFEFREELLRERVKLLGTIERQPDDFIFDLLIGDSFIIRHFVFSAKVLRGLFY